MTCTATMAGGATPALASFPNVTYLNTMAAQRPSDVFVGPVRTANVLAAGKAYRVVVSGTASLWAKARWTDSRFSVCGNPLKLPMYRTLGFKNGPVGVDAFERFAIVT